MIIVLRCDWPRGWRARSMDAGLPSSRRVTKLAAIPISQRQRQSRRKSAMTSHAMACSRDYSTWSFGLQPHPDRLRPRTGYWRLNAVTSHGMSALRQQLPCGQVRFWSLADLRARPLLSPRSEVNRTWPFHEYTAPTDRSMIPRSICPTGKSLIYLSSPPRKNILVLTRPKSLLELPRPVPHRGAFRDRHGRRERDAMDAAGQARISALTNG